MITNFNILFAEALKDDGIYITEDLHVNYWTPWRDSRHSFLDVCKELMELMHAHYSLASLTEWTRESDSESDPFALDVPAISMMIKEIRVFDSIVAIYKTLRYILTRVLTPLAD